MDSMKVIMMDPWFDEHDFDLLRGRSPPENDVGKVEIYL